MVTFRSITLSLISQFDILTLPEYSPESPLEAFAVQSSPGFAPPTPRIPLIDADTSTVTAYVPIYPNSRLWLSFASDPDQTPAGGLYFKLFVNGVLVESWGCDAENAFRGHIMFSLAPAHWQGGWERRMLSFAADHDTPPDRAADDPLARSALTDLTASEGDQMVIRVYRVRARKRILPKPRELPRVAGEGPPQGADQSIRFRAAGYLEKRAPLRYYRYLLLDALDEPYVTFRYLFRTTEELQQLGIVLATNPRQSLPPPAPDRFQQTSNRRSSMAPSFRGSYGGDGSNETTQLESMLSSAQNAASTCNQKRQGYKYKYEERSLHYGDAAYEECETHWLGRRSASDLPSPSISSSPSMRASLRRLGQGLVSPFRNRPSTPHPVLPADSLDDDLNVPALAPILPAIRASTPMSSNLTRGSMSSDPSDSASPMTKPGSTASTPVKSPRRLWKTSFSSPSRSSPSSPATESKRRAGAPHAPRDPSWAPDSPRLVSPRTFGSPRRSMSARHASPRELIIHLPRDSPRRSASAGNSSASLRTGSSTLRADQYPAVRTASADKALPSLPPEAQKHLSPQGRFDFSVPRTVVSGPSGSPATPVRARTSSSRPSKHGHNEPSQMSSPRQAMRVQVSDQAQALSPRVAACEQQLPPRISSRARTLPPRVAYSRGSHHLPSTPPQPSPGLIAYARNAVPLDCSPTSPSEPSPASPCPPASTLVSASASASASTSTSTSARRLVMLRGIVDSARRRRSPDQRATDE